MLDTLLFVSYIVIITLIKLFLLSSLGITSESSGKEIFNDSTLPGFLYCVTPWSAVSGNYLGKAKRVNIFSLQGNSSNV